MKRFGKSAYPFLALCVLAMTACNVTTVPGDGGDNGGSDNGGSDSGGGVGSDTMSTLTLRITGPVGSELARVYGIKDSGPQVHEDLIDRVPQSDFSLTLPLFSTNGVIEQSWAFPNGTQIALVAVESEGFLTATPPPETIESFPSQFVTWSGDVTGDASNNPAALYFVINENRTITAEYKAMNAMYIEASQGGPHTSIAISVDVDRYILDDEDIPMSGAGASDMPTPHVLWGYYRDDAKVALQVRDYVDDDVATCNGMIEGPCFVFESWSGDCGGSGKTCVVDFFDEHRSTVNFTDING
ncbi:MAG TPA: hypothetical protein PKN33_04135 [Phycisphaerae bacterium]|nr:hypothetical protein [Phycisphaerae bacterium]